MNINIWTTWENNSDYENWRNSSPDSEHETIATVDNGKIRLEYDYCDGKIIVTEMVVDDDDSCWEIVNEYLSSKIVILSDTLEDLIQWLVTEIMK